MKKYLCIIIWGLTIACQPQKVEPARIGKVWKAVNVKQNGVVVYAEGDAGSTKPTYARFRLDLTSVGQVIYTDLDGRKLTGQWSLSTDNNRLILENLTPPPSESNGNIEFYLTAPPSDDHLSLKRTNESRKTGNSVNEYELVPVE